MSPWYPRIDEVRSSGWSGAEQDTEPVEQLPNSRKDES